MAEWINDMTRELEGHEEPQSGNTYRITQKDTKKDIKLVNART